MNWVILILAGSVVVSLISMALIITFQKNKIEKLKDENANLTLENSEKEKDLELARKFSIEIQKNEKNKFEILEDLKHEKDMDKRRSKLLSSLDYSD